MAASAISPLRAAPVRDGRVLERLRAHALGLPVREQRALRAYTDDAEYDAFRRHQVLRLQARAPRSGPFARMGEAMLSALRRSRLEQPLAVYRGGDLGEWPELAAAGPSGDAVPFRFWSTSLSPAVAADKARLVRPGRAVLARLHVAAGVPAIFLGGLSHFPGEMEVLLDRDAARVTLRKIRRLPRIALLDVLVETIPVSAISVRNP